MSMDFTPNGRPRIFEIENPSGGFYQVGIEVDPKFAEIGTAPAFGSTIDTVIDSSYLDAKYSGMVFTKATQQKDGTFLLLFERLPGTPLAGWELPIREHFGGGKLATTEQSVAPGTSLVEGFKIVSASITPEGAGKSKLTISQLPDGESWPTLHESERVEELDVFVSIEKTVLENLGQDSSLVTAGGFIILTEYRDEDKWRTMQIVSKIPDSIIGKTITSRQPIQYSIPHEIPVTPVMVKAYSIIQAIPDGPILLPDGTLIPPAQIAIAKDLANDLAVTEAELDYSVVQGYSGPFSAKVTRTVSTESATEVEYQWFPKNEHRRIPISINYQTVERSQGKIFKFDTPAAIHGDWAVDVENIYTYVGTWVAQWDLSGTPPSIINYTKVFFPASSGPLTITKMGWYTEPVYSESTLQFTAAATVPAAIPHGEEIIARVVSNKWRFNLWINDVYRITMP